VLTLSLSSDRTCWRAALSRLQPKSISCSTRRARARLKASLASGDSKSRGRAQLVRARTLPHHSWQAPPMLRVMAQHPSTMTHPQPNNSTRLARKVKAGPYSKNWKLILKINQISNNFYCLTRLKILLNVLIKFGCEIYLWRYSPMIPHFWFWNPNQRWNSPPLVRVW